MPTKHELKQNLKALKARLEGKPMDLDARMRMARTHRLLGEKKPAVAHYRAVARYLSLAGQPLQAIAVLKELLQIDPEHEETLLFLAKLYARTRVTDGNTRGRVAVPIADPPAGPIALPEGMPASATGVWDAIRPMATDIFTVVRDADEVGAKVGGDGDDDGGEDEALSIAAELRELEDTLDLDEDDIVEELAVEDVDAKDLVVEDAQARKLAVEEALVEEAPIEEAPIEEAHGEEAHGEDPFAAFGSSDEDEDGVDALSTQDILLPHVPLFSSLPPEAFIELGRAVVLRRSEAGAVLFDEGDPADTFLVVSRGQAKASRVGDDGREVELMTLSEGDFAGLFALFAAETRNARLVATTSLEYFEIERAAVEGLADKHPQAKSALAHFFRERMLLSLLAALPCFSTLSAADRQTLARRFKNKTHEPDDELFYQGFSHDGLWVVLEGEVHVGREGSAPAFTLGPGDYVGSFAGTDDGETEMGAIASEPTVVALLPHKTLGDVLEAHPDLAEIRRAFEAAGLMLTRHVFVGSGRPLGDLSKPG